MAGFDRKIKKLSKKFKAPEQYHKRIDGILESIEEESIPTPRRRNSVRFAGIVVIVCVIVVGCLCLSSPEVAEASFLETFKQTIMDFFGMGENESQKIGVESEKEKAVSKSDLAIELQEKVMDEQNMYVVVKITAPSDVEFNEDISFEYFGFCKGSNYNASDLISGAKGCKLLETLETKKNVATYVVEVAADHKIEEGEEVTAFFKNLMSNPYGDNPQMLVEGMWRVTFTASYTVSEDIVVKGTEDMTYSFLDTQATVVKMKFTPLGMTLNSDVSNVPYEELNVSDTRITIRLKMIDGSEKIVISPDPETPVISNSGSDYFSQKKGRTYIKKSIQFQKALDIDQVLGVYIEDSYIPIKEFD